MWQPATKQFNTLNEKCTSFVLKVEHYFREKALPKIKISVNQTGTKRKVFI